MASDAHTVRKEVAPVQTDSPHPYLDSIARAYVWVYGEEVLRNPVTPDNARLSAKINARHAVWVKGVPRHHYHRSNRPMTYVQFNQDLVLDLAPHVRVFGWYYKKATATSLAFTSFFALLTPIYPTEEPV